MARAFLALGSNIGDKAGNLREAVGRLALRPGIALCAASTIYRTAPWGKLDQDWFANAVIAVETGLGPEQLLETALEVEMSMGRLRNTRWGPRVIDIDLLLHGEERRRGANLHLPHPAMLERAFVLVPLSEIAPELMLNGLPVRQHLARLSCQGIEVMAQTIAAAEPA